MQITLTPAERDALIDSVMANYPEASSPSLKCLSYNYAFCHFEFIDVEAKADDYLNGGAQANWREESLTFAGYGVEEVRDCVVFELGRDDLRRGMDCLFTLFAAGELPGIWRYVGQAPLDAGNWDADAADALVQCAIFGEVRYG